MSQPLAGTFTNLGQKTKDKARRRPKPGPEWGKALNAARVQLMIVSANTALPAWEALSNGSPVAAAKACYNSYLLLKGMQNYFITRRSADEAPLRELLGDRAPANDNLLTLNQSLSNSFSLMSRSLFSNVAQGFAEPAFDAATGQTTPSLMLQMYAVGIVVSGSVGKMMHTLQRRHGPPRMPSITGKLKL